MAVIAIAPIILRDCVLDIKLVGAGTADSYQNHVSRVAFVPSTSVVRFRGMAPAAKWAGQTDPDWSIELAFVQDFTTVNGLSEWLLTNVGKEAEFSFRPRGGVTPGKKITAIVTPGVYGGDVDSIPTATATMGCTGVPTALP